MLLVQETFGDVSVVMQGFSLVPVHHKNITSLVAFGGFKKEPSNQV